MLVYATEGLRWPLVQMLRPVAQRFGFETVDRAVAGAGMPANRRRTYLDDLFVPYIDFYSWPCLRGLLEQAGFERIERWKKGRLDHEETLDAYVRDLKGFLEVFQAVSQLMNSSDHAQSTLASKAIGFCKHAVEQAEAIAIFVRDGVLSEADGRALTIGQGHHRLISWKR